MSISTPKVIVCTVGGSPEPLRTTICFHKPSHVIYFASPESRCTIRGSVEADLAWHIGDTQIVTLSNVQDIVQCVLDMRKGIPQALRDMSLPEDTPLIADITGGTKIMSAALALVMMEFQSRFSYVGGCARTKDGLGIVKSGTEKVVQDANPWDVLALREARALAHSFNNAQFVDALTTAQTLAQKMDDAGKKKFYGAIAAMVQGYMLWDSFDHKAALGHLRQAHDRLVPYVVRSKRLAELHSGLQQDVERLEIVCEDAKMLRNMPAQPTDEMGNAYLRDLLGNAQRRAAAGHYDDAVARLYSAIEKCAKCALRVRHGIDNGHVRPEQVPASLREDWHSSLEAEGTARVGLEKSFQLLAALDDPLGKDFLASQHNLKKVLECRNASLLAHGYFPIGKEKYEKLLAVALDFLRTDTASLPVFPRIDWKALLP
ncbi:TIGR02710 family CRISPR-associated CARF protein [Desulfovibrio legallii]|uniref:CRISPR-associated protein, TIGR02710 family n=1 Tax=Desulfovibrio legallii TaxID=571438 RepID=A0A1G7JZW4_9BACT|nr:TIGR02710 family CRISPR-associated CARF protein [Desulfovibrio legallii]SDF30402.1 CRISPR-associated protein, TIGR02710 family [Desulfovibrio legallii]